MTSSPFVSTTRLKSRRDQLKQERAWRELQGIIRGICVVSFAGFSFWLLTLPDWVIREKQQIKIQGNELLSPDEVRSLVPLDYPQSLLQLSTRDLTNKLRQKIPLANVVVTREFIPPSLTVEINEKPLIAIAYGNIISPNNQQLTVKKLGYLDQDGVFVSADLYEKLGKNPDQAPKLKVLGNPDLYLPYWKDLYNLIIKSSVKITEIDWQNPNNLILSTDLGKVYIGAITSKLPQQLTVLAKLKPLTSKIRREDIVYIDLQDPEIPLVKQKMPEIKTTEEQKNKP